MNKSENKRLFRAGDLIAILLVALLAIGLFIAFFTAERGGYVEISVHGDELLTLPLDVDDTRIIGAGAYELTVVIEKGSVYVHGSTCPDHVCEQTGRISKEGAVIICAPAGISVKILGGGDEDVDHIAG
ncbi:MAG: NusG domain II-containing protein [Clostridia bacterium]|nr:NusG domain II-containing protein [Clostridia bacterium]